jgi:peroxiredoxin
VAAVCIAFLIVAEWLGSRRPATLLALGDKPYAAPAGEGRELLGVAMPEWSFTDWLQSDPLTLQSLRGKVVVVRWWTADGPYCEASAIALNDFWHLYRRRGVVIIGAYFTPESDSTDRAEMQQRAKKLGFEFPVAFDPGRATLRKWWLDANSNRWSTPTFVLDKTGIVRYVHPGGAYYRGESGYDALQHWIEELQ